MKLKRSISETPDAVLANMHYENRKTANIDPQKNLDIESEIARRHGGLSYTIAREYQIDGTDLPDRAAECLVALVHAVRLWEPQYGKQIKGWIRLKMKSALTDMWRKQNRAKAIPDCAMSSLDDPVGDDDLDITDIIAGAVDLMSEYEDKEEALEALEMLSYDCLETLYLSHENPFSVLDIELMNAVRIYAQSLPITDDWTLENRMMVEDATVTGVSLFNSESRSRHALPPVVRGVYIDFSKLQGSVVFGLANGWTLSEVGRHFEQPVEVLRAIVRALKAARPDVKAALEEPVTSFAA